MLKMEAFAAYNSRKLPISGRLAGEDHTPLDLVAMSLHNVVCLPLLDYGELIVGRSPDTHVPQGDPALSPRHARITVLPGSLAVEDLGSGAGTYLREVALAPGEKAGFMPGEPLRLGQTVVIVRRRSARLELRRLWSPSEFAALVEDECLRARRRASVFAVAHLALDGEPLPPPDLVSQLERALPRPHMLGAGASGGLQALLVAVPPPLMRACLRRLFRGLRQRGQHVRLGIAWYPGDGRTPWSLQALARRRAELDVRAQPEE